MATPKAFWPYVVTAGAGDSLVVSLAAGSYKATLTPGVYYSAADLAAAVQAALIAAAGAYSWAVSVASGQFSIGCSSPFTLRKTDGMNFLVRSAEFDNASWFKSFTSVTANDAGTTDPLGGATADLLGLGSSSVVRQDATAAVATNDKWVASVWLKATSGMVGKAISLYLEGIGGLAESVHSDLVLSGSWQRVSVSKMFSGSYSTLRVRLATLDSGGVWAWGAQLEPGVSSGVYRPTTSAPITTATDCSPLFYLLGWTVEDPALAAPQVAPYQHANGWYADRAARFDSKEQYDRVIAGDVSLSGVVRSVQLGDVRESRAVEFGMLRPEKTKIAREGAATNQAIERLWRSGAARFRWWPDSTDEGTWTDYALDPSHLADFKPAREKSSGLERYSIAWVFRRFVA